MKRQSAAKRLVPENDVPPRKKSKPEKRPFDEVENADKNSSHSTNKLSEIAVNSERNSKSCGIFGSTSDPGVNIKINKMDKTGKINKEILENEEHLNGKLANFEEDSELDSSTSGDEQSDVQMESGSENSEYEFTSSLNQSSKIGRKEGFYDESRASFSSIYFGKSDEIIESENSRPNSKPYKNRQKTDILTQSSDQTEHNVNSSTKKTSAPKSQLPNKLGSQEPLSLIAEAMQSVEPELPIFNQKESTEIREPTIKPIVSLRNQLTEGRKSIVGVRTQGWDDSYDSSKASEPPAAVSCAEKKRVFEKNMITYLTKMSRISTDRNAVTGSPGSNKDTDSDDSGWRRKAPTLKTDINNGRDFYEDESTYEDDKINSDDDEASISSDPPYSNVLYEYEQLFHEIRKIMDKVPNRFKYEIHCLLYPTLAMVYLRMIASGKYRKGKAFVESSQRYLDHSCMTRVDKLMALQTPGDLPNKAKKLISDDNEKLSVGMFEETYYLVFLSMESWNRNTRMTFIRHFYLYPDDNGGEPRQHNRIGSAMLDKIYWGTPDSGKEKREGSPRPSRRRRFKKDKTSPNRNGNLPAGNRLYTPTPKRWDLERHKDDEERRVPLNRDSLPSVYLYTALETVETVICATFSNKSTMLSIGTASSAIHVFALTATKLVQLKSAECLKRLDTSMSGIDESMLDATKKKTKRTLYGHQGPVYGCTFAPHDRFLLSCSQDRTVRCWCLLSWSCVVIYPGHCAAIYSVNYAPLGYYFATGSDDRTARIWTQDSKKSVCILVGHLAEVICCHFHPNRHYLATGSADCTVRIWDIIKAVQVRVLSGHRDAINALAFSMCGRYLISGGDDHFLVVWDIDNEKLVRSLAFHTASINSIEFALDNKIFMAGGQDCQMTIWDFERLVENCEKGKQTDKNVDTEPQQSKLSSQHFLIKSYASKGTPFYKLWITRRNLLLGFCVRLAKDAAMDEISDQDARYIEWLEFLDILKLKACFAQPNNSESNKFENSTVLEESETLKNTDVKLLDDEKVTEPLRNTVIEPSENEGELELLRSPDANFFSDNEEDSESLGNSDTESSENDDNLKSSDVESLDDYENLLRNRTDRNFEDDKEGRKKLDTGNLNDGDDLETSKIANEENSDVECLKYKKDIESLKNAKAKYSEQSKERLETVTNPDVVSFNGNENLKVGQITDVESINNERDTESMENSDCKFVEDRVEKPFENYNEESDVIKITNTKCIGNEEYTVEYLDDYEESETLNNTYVETHENNTEDPEVILNTSIEYVVVNEEDTDSLRNVDGDDENSEMDNNKEETEVLTNSDVEYLEEEEKDNEEELRTVDIAGVEEAAECMTTFDDASFEEVAELDQILECNAREKLLGNCDDEPLGECVEAIMLRNLLEDDNEMKDEKQPETEKTLEYLRDSEEEQEESRKPESIEDDKESQH